MFTFFKKLFKGTSPTSSHPKRFSHSVNQTKSKSVVDKPVSNPQISKTPQVTKPHELVNKIPATVLIKFVDEQQQALKSPLIFKGRLGDPLNLTVPNLTGYLFQKIDGLSSKINATQQTITIHYQKELGQPVMIYCFDYDTNQLLSTPTFMTGPLNEAYQVVLPPINGYQIHFSLGQQTGVYTHEPQNVILYYRRNNWKIVQPVNYLVKIKSSTQVYPDPFQKTPYAFKLPTGSVWKVFKEVHTNDTTWLSLGGAEWVKQAYVSRIAAAPKKLN